MAFIQYAYRNSSRGHKFFYSLCFTAHFDLSKSLGKGCIYLPFYPFPGLKEVGKKFRTERTYRVWVDRTILGKLGKSEISPRLVCLIPPLTNMGCTVLLRRVIDGILQTEISIVLQDSLRNVRAALGEKFF